MQAKKNKKCPKIIKDNYQVPIPTLFHVLVAVQI